MENQGESDYPVRQEQAGLKVRTQLRAGEIETYDQCMGSCLPKLKSFPACWKACEPWLDDEPA
ncbi:MAG TPA: hypothetical protein VHO48_00450 [Anaerolineaceae bacterium]|nr:hypothetical protein [Anaerolineaceae bacterium]